MAKHFHIIQLTIPYETVDAGRQMFSITITNACKRKVRRIIRGVFEDQFGVTPRKDYLDAVIKHYGVVTTPERAKAMKRKFVDAMLNRMEDECEAIEKERSAKREATYSQAAEI